MRLDSYSRIGGHGIVRFGGRLGGRITSTGTCTYLVVEQPENIATKITAIRYDTINNHGNFPLDVSDSFDDSRSDDDFTFGDFTVCLPFRARLFDGVLLRFLDRGRLRLRVRVPPGFVMLAPVPMQRREQRHEPEHDHSHVHVEAHHPNAF